VGGKGLRSSLTPGELKRRYTVFSANVLAMARYEGGRLAADVWFVNAKEHPSAPDWAAGWRELAAHMELREIAGDHYSIMKPPNVRTLAETVLEAISRKRESGTSARVAEASPSQWSSSR
jgi:thioesterase domain-containing protein